MFFDLVPSPKESRLLLWLHYHAHLDLHSSDSYGKIGGLLMSPVCCVSSSSDLIHLDGVQLEHIQAEEIHCKRSL